MSSDDDAVLAAMEWDLAYGPDPVLVDAVRREVNRGRPWWRRASFERVSDLVGAVQAVRAEGLLGSDDPHGIEAVVTASGLRGRRVVELAWQVTTAVLAIEEWNSR